MKNYLNKRGYVLLKKNYDENILNNIRNELTVKPKVIPGYGVEPEPFKVYLENTNKLYLPRFYGLNKVDNKILNKLSNPKRINVKFKGKLRDIQKEPIKKCLETFKNIGGGILSLPCGFGKTCCGCYLVSKMKTKTLVIVNKGFLVDQWKERIQQFLPKAKIGKIQQKIVDIENKDIVIGMLQSIAKRKYDKNVFDSFGLVILDECHTVPSKVFSKALQKLNSKYMLGLSATPTRKDGLTKVLKWYIGDIIYKYDKLDTRFNVNVERYIYKNDKDIKYCKECLLYTKKPNIAKMITNIVECHYRNKLIINLLFKKYKEKRKILILSGRRKHLEELNKLIEKKKKGISGFYMGGMKENELKESETKPIIFGTYSMASTGMDISGLNTLILASPMSTIEQSVGRILRKKNKDFDPIVIDICDIFSTFYNQINKRKKFYLKKKYNIISYDVNYNGTKIEKCEEEKEDIKEIHDNKKLVNLFSD